MSLFFVSVQRFRCGEALEKGVPRVQSNLTCCCSCSGLSHALLPCVLWRGTRVLQFFTRSTLISALPGRAAWPPHDDRVVDDQKPHGALRHPVPHVRVLQGGEEPAEGRRCAPDAQRPRHANQHAEPRCLSPRRPSPCSPPHGTRRAQTRSGSCTGACTRSSPSSSSSSTSSSRGSRSTRPVPRPAHPPPPRFSRAALWPGTRRASHGGAARQELKLLFIIWLALPYTRGSLLVWEKSKDHIERLEDQVPLPCDPSARSARGARVLRSTSFSVRVQRA